MTGNYIKLSNDQVESEFRGAGIPHQVKFRDKYDHYTKILQDKYELSESAKLEIYSTSRQALNYAHLDDPEWSGHEVLSRVFADKQLCMRFRDLESDRLFVIDGKFAGTAIDFLGGGRCVLFLQDCSFLLVDHFSFNIIYDGERNEFYEHANKLLQDFYKK